MTKTPPQCLRHRRNGWCNKMQWFVTCSTNFVPHAAQHRFHATVSRQQCSYSTKVLTGGFRLRDRSSVRHYGCSHIWMRQRVQTGTVRFSRRQHIANVFTKLYYIRWSSGLCIGVQHSCYRTELNSTIVRYRLACRVQIIDVYKMFITNLQQKLSPTCNWPHVW